MPPKPNTIFLDDDDDDDVLLISSAPPPRFQTAAGNAISTMAGPHVSSSGSAQTNAESRHQSTATRAALANSQANNHSSSGGGREGGGFKPPRDLRDFFNRAAAANKDKKAAAEQQTDESGNTLSSADAFAKDLLERHFAAPNGQQNNNSTHKNNNKMDSNGNAQQTTTMTNAFGGPLSTMPLKMRMALRGTRGCPIVGTRIDPEDEARLVQKYAPRSPNGTNNGAQRQQKNRGGVHCPPFSFERAAAWEGYHDDGGRRDAYETTSSAIVIASHRMPAPTCNGSLLAASASSSMEITGSATSLVATSSASTLGTSSLAFAQQHLRDQLFLFQSRRDVFGANTDHLVRDRCNVHQSLRGNPMIRVASTSAADSFSATAAGAGTRAAIVGVTDGNNARNVDTEANEEDIFEDEEEGRNDIANRRRAAQQQRGTVGRGGGNRLRTTDVSRAIACASTSAIRSIVVTHTGRIIFVKRASLEIYDLNTLLSVHGTEIERNETRVLSAGDTAENDCHRFQNNQDILFSLGAYGHLRPFNVNRNASSNFRNLNVLMRNNRSVEEPSEALMTLIRRAVVGRGDEDDDDNANDSVQSMLACLEDVHYRPIPSWANLDFYARCRNFTEFVQRLRSNKAKMLERIASANRNVNDKDDDDNDNDDVVAPQEENDHQRGALIPSVLSDFVSANRFPLRNSSDSNTISGGVFPFIPRAAPQSFLPLGGGAVPRHFIIAVEPFTGATARSDGGQILVSVHSDTYALFRGGGGGVSSRSNIASNTCLPAHAHLEGLAYATRAETISLLAIPHPPSHSPSALRRGNANHPSNPFPSVNSIVILVGTFDGRLLVYQSRKHSPSDAEGGGSNGRGEGRGDGFDEDGYAAGGNGAFTSAFDLIYAASVATAVHDREEALAAARAANENGEENTNSQQLSFPTLLNPNKKKASGNGLQTLGHSRSGQNTNMVNIDDDGENGVSGVGEHTNTFLGKPIGHYAVTSIQYVNANSVCSVKRPDGLLPLSSLETFSSATPLDTSTYSTTPLIVYSGTASGHLIAWDVPIPIRHHLDHHRRQNGLGNFSDEEAPPSTPSSLPAIAKILEKPLAILPIASLLFSTTLRTLVGSTHVSHIVVPVGHRQHTGGGDDNDETITTTANSASSPLAPPPSSRVLWASVAAGGLCRIVLGAKSHYQLAVATDDKGDSGDLKDFGDGIDASDEVFIESCEAWTFPEMGRGHNAAHRHSSNMSDAASAAHVNASLLDFRAGAPFAVLHDTAFWPHLSTMKIHVAMPSNLRANQQYTTLYHQNPQQSVGGGGGREEDSCMSISMPYLVGPPAADEALLNSRKGGGREHTDKKPNATLTVRNVAHRYSGSHGAMCYGGESESLFRARRVINMPIIIPQTFSTSFSAAIANGKADEVTADMANEGGGAQLMEGATPKRSAQAASRPAAKDPSASSIKRRKKRYSATLGKQTMQMLMASSSEDDDDMNAMLERAFGSNGGDIADDSDAEWRGAASDDDVDEATNANVGAMLFTDDDDDDDDEARFLEKVSCRVAKKLDQQEASRQQAAANRQRMGWGSSRLLSAAPPQPPRPHTSAQPFLSSVAVADGALNARTRPTAAQHRQLAAAAAAIPAGATNVGVNTTALSQTTPPPLVEQPPPSLIFVHPPGSGLLTLSPLAFTPTCCVAIPAEESIVVGLINGDVLMMKFSDVSMSNNLE